MTQLSPNFTLAEMTATKTGLQNIPSEAIIARLTHTAQQMESVRALLDKPIIVHSGYRSLAVNTAVGGSATSDHMKGEACDFVCPDFGTPMEVADAILASGIKYDQLIREGGDHTGAGGWVHCSFASPMRQTAMTATFKDGKPHYAEGIIA